MNTKNAPNRCLVPKESVLLKTVVFWHKSKLEIINKKISPNLMKRTDFLVHKAQILVGVTGFEPAASTSQTQKCRFFPYSTRLFGAF